MFFFQLHYVRFRSMFVESPDSYNDRFFLFMARKPLGRFGANSAAGLPTIGVRYEACSDGSFCFTNSVFA